MKVFRLLVPLVILGGLTGCREPRVELTLTMQKPRIAEGEFLWYRMEMKNFGWHAVIVSDPFWTFRDRLHENARIAKGTFLLGDGPSGQMIRPRTGFWPHGYQLYWDDDCGEFTSCGKVGHRYHVLKGGESLATTQSMPADVAGALPPGFAGPKGFRALDTNVPLEKGSYRVKAVADYEYGGVFEDWPFSGGFFGRLDPKMTGAVESKEVAFEVVPATGSFEAWEGVNLVTAPRRPQKARPIKLPPLDDMVGRSPIRGTD